MWASNNSSSAQIYIFKQTNIYLSVREVETLDDDIFAAHQSQRGVWRTLSQYRLAAHLLVRLYSPNSSFCCQPPYHLDDVRIALFALQPIDMAFTPAQYA